MFKHILVPTDGSQLSTDTAKRAITFAKEAGAKITFFFAKPDYPLTSAHFLGKGGMISPSSLDQFTFMAEQQAQEIFAAYEAAAKAAGVEYACIHTTSKTPHEAIIAAAEQAGADLIFMASYGRRGLSGLLLGSETQKVLTHSKIPVLVYR